MSTVNQGRARLKSATTLTELIVVLTILSVIGMLLLTVINGVKSVVRTTTSRKEVLRDTRYALDELTKRLSRATLLAKPSFFNEKTTFYNDGELGLSLRESDVVTHRAAVSLMIGRSAALFQSDMENYPGHSIAWVAPDGYTREPALEGLKGGLNSMGVFVEYGKSQESILILLILGCKIENVITWSWFGKRWKIFTET